MSSSVWVEGGEVTGGKGGLGAIYGFEVLREPNPRSIIMDYSSVIDGYEDF